MNEPEYFVLVQDEPTGPFSVEQLSQMLLNKEINADAVCAVLGAKEWRPVGVVITSVKGRHQRPVGPHAEFPRANDSTKADGRNSRTAVVFTTIAVLGFLFCLVVVPEFWRVAVIVIGFCIYFLPSFLGRENRNAVAIFLLNLLLGWTLLGWVGALIWSLYQEKR